jgi:hypothetical protein
MYYLITLNVNIFYILWKKAMNYHGYYLSIVISLVLVEWLNIYYSKLLLRGLASLKGMKN